MCFGLRNHPPCCQYKFCFFKLKIFFPKIFTTHLFLLFIFSIIFVNIKDIYFSLYRWSLFKKSSSKWFSLMVILTCLTVEKTLVSCIILLFQIFKSSHVKIHCCCVHQYEKRHQSSAVLTTRMENNLYLTTITRKQEKKPWTLYFNTFLYCIHKSKKFTYKRSYTSRIYQMLYKLNFFFLFQKRYELKDRALQWLTFFYFLSPSCSLSFYSSFLVFLYIDAIWCASHHNKKRINCGRRETSFSIEHKKKHTTSTSASLFIYI